jgi:hypothetical protein
MKWPKRLALAVLGYVVLVVLFESFVGYMGRRHASRGVAPDRPEVLLTTMRADGTPADTVVGGFEMDGRLYVAANHWPRAWYARALAHPDIEVTRGGARTPYRAVPIEGDELARVARSYHLPGIVRFLTGFPARRFLRLDPR